MTYDTMNAKEQVQILRHAAVEWLRYERLCSIVCFERSPITSGWKPDVIAMTKKRCLIEVEIKRTIADFKADQKKRSKWCRFHYCDQCYYLVSPKIVASAKHLLPEKCGLLTLEGVSDYSRLPAIKAVVRAPKLGNVSTERAERTMIRNMTGTLVSLLRDETKRLDYVRAD